MDRRHETTAETYRRFARGEAAGRSPLYEALSLRIAEDAAVLDFLLTLPPPKRQPNLLLAAYRWHRGVAAGWEEFRAGLLAEAPAIRATMLERATQTNEPGRCATLLPVLAGLPQPLALIEVGASAGLCLLPELYGYDYGASGSLPGEPAFPCAFAGPVPGRKPEVVWRAGLELNPIDVTDQDAARWLETLVWPEQTGRLDRLRGALAVARRNPPRLVQGDLRRDLAALAAEAPRGATRVIFHTAVLAYLPDLAEREAFAREVRGLCDVWIANEAPGVFPEIAAKAGEPRPGRFLLSVNGEPVGWTDPHGASLDWL